MNGEKVNEEIKCMKNQTTDLQNKIQIDEQNKAKLLDNIAIHKMQLLKTAKEIDMLKKEANCLQNSDEANCSQMKK